MTQRSGATATGYPVAGAAEHGVYVYGVVRTSTAPEAFPKGVAGGESPVRLLEHGDLAVVANDVPVGWEAATRADVEAHEHVLSSLVEGRTVVPMRFGVVLDSEEAAREILLVEHESEVRALLARLDGHIQMSVKAYYGEESLLRQVLTEHPELKQRSDALQAAPTGRGEQERIALGQDVAYAVQEQRARDEQMLAAPLAAAAAEISLEALRSERLALNAQLLVARDRRDVLDATVERLTREFGDRFAFRYVGPLAPYSFSDLALEPQGNAWG